MNSKSEQTDPGKDEIELLRQALSDQEAEIARLNDECRQHMAQAMANGKAANEAEALLRMTANNLAQQNDLTATLRIITAHLGGEHE